MAYKMLINGKLVDGAKTLDVINPATGDVLAACPRADEAQLNQAVAAAKAAFPAWSAPSFAERRKKLEAIADALEARADEFARLLTQEQGKPLAAGDRRGHAARSPACATFAAADVETKCHPRDRQRAHRPAAHAAGRRRRHHAVELPGHADGDEARPGAAHRQHRWSPSPRRPRR